MDFLMKPIGVIHSPFTDKQQTPIQPTRSQAVGQWVMPCSYGRWQAMLSLLKGYASRPSAVILRRAAVLITSCAILDMWVRILAQVSTPFLLGSPWALIPSIASGFLYVVRTFIEDQTLKRELPGYAEYANQTRYRLLPGVW
jgi:hypothetical protein